MDIKQVKKEITKLELDLLTKLKAFETLTGTTVMDIHLERPNYFTLGQPGAVQWVKTNIKISGDYE